MDFKFPFVLLASLIVVLGLTPFGLAQLDPDENAYMEIDILAGQTENPFSIQDENDVELFGIDVNGHPTKEHNWRELNYYNTGTVSGINNLYSALPTDKTYSHPSVLAQWELTGDTRTLGHLFRSDQTIAITEFIRNSGTGVCILEAEQYAFGSWSNVNGINVGGTSGVWLQDDSIDVNAQYSDIEAVRVHAYVTNADTTCSFRFIETAFTLHVPPDIIVTRVK